ncbi:hypothetical protein [Tsukamurella soli]
MTTKTPRRPPLSYGILPLVAMVFLLVGVPVWAWLFLAVLAAIEVTIYVRAGVLDARRRAAAA